MNEISRAGLETETPVNPYSLLEAVNRSSDKANTAWLILVALMCYLLITVASVTHKDLLLNSDITLPLLQVKIGLTRFFLFAPLLLVLLHVGVMSQLSLLARKALEFADSIRMLESTDRRTHPLRLELDNFFFVQAVAGPERSRVVGIFLHGMSWLTVVLLPAVLLLYVQTAFLPFHDPLITSVHRWALITDIVLVLLIGVFLLRAETTFFQAFWRAGVYHPLGLVLTCAALGAIGFLSLFVATVPGEYGEDTGRSGGGQTRIALGYTLPSLGIQDGALFGLFYRNLNAPDLDLVVDKDVMPGEPSLSLRGRDLRFAKLDRSDLHQADLSGAILDGASLVGTDLRNAWMQCADPAELRAGNRPAAKCTSARGANFTRARLTGARLTGIDLSGARLDEAQLDGAVLARGRLAGASLALANVQGADLAGARLPLADLRGARLQGANLSLAALEGAQLREAELDGASLQSARLIGADLAGARIAGADLTDAVVWRTMPPSADSATLSDLGALNLRAPTPEELVQLKAATAGLDGELATRLEAGLAPLLDSTKTAGWAGSPEQQAWLVLAKPADPSNPDSAATYKSRLTDFLARLMCRSRHANASVATGIARRATSQGFKGDVAGLNDKLRAADCSTSTAVDPRILRELAAAADALRVP
jgi:uncharacterized protein YjbI with pentapeptide repeats